MESLNPLIATFLENALETSNGIKIDYAIDARDFISDVPSSPYLVHHGERNFLYQWFKSFFDNEHGARENADLMLLYLIIKCKVRREFVQTNNLRGFVNFQDYDHEKVSTLDTEEENGKKLLGRLPIDMLCRLLAETKRDSILKRELPQIT